MARESETTGSASSPDMPDTLANMVRKKYPLRRKKVGKGGKVADSDGGQVVGVVVVEAEVHQDREEGEDTQEDGGEAQPQPPAEEEEDLSVEVCMKKGNFQ